MPQSYTCVPNGVPPTQYVNNTGAGTPVLNYDIGFPYIQTTDIVVFTGDTGNWTQRNQGTGSNEYQINPQGGLATDEVVFNNGVGGANILIWRRTDLCDMGRTFTAGSSIRAEDLNQDFTQLLYVLQEAGSLIDGIVDGGIGGGGLPLPGDQIDLDDLGDVEISSPANPSWLRWNGTKWEDQPILEDGDTWVADDNHVVTSAAGDDRWLNASGGDVVGGDSITSTESSGKVTLDIDLAANGGLESTNPGNAAGELRVDDGNGIVVNSDGVNVGAGTGITVNADDVAVTQVNLWGRPHNHGADVSGDMSGVGDITFSSSGGELNTIGNQDIVIAANGSGEFEINRDVDLNGDLDVSGTLNLADLTITGDLTVGGEVELGDAATDQHQIHGDLTILADSDIKFLGTSSTDPGSALFRAPAQFKTSGDTPGHDMVYTLPDTGPTDNQVLSSSSSGELTWVANSGGGGTGAIQDLGKVQSSADTNNVQITISDGGSNVTINGATTTVPGVMTAAQASKLNGIADNAEVNQDTNITVVENESTVTIQSSTGTNDDIQAATSSAAGVMTAADRTRFDGLPGNAQGVVNVGDLDDVVITSVAEGQVIRWNATDSEWQNQNLFSSDTVLNFRGVIDMRTNNPNIPYGDIVAGDFWVHDDPMETDPADVSGTAQRDQSVPSGWTTINNPGSGSETDGTDPLSVVRGSMVVAGREYDISGTNKRGFMILGTLNAGTIASVDAGTGITVTESGGVATVSISNIADVAGTHGSSTVVPQLEINGQGQITGVTDVTIDQGISAVSPGTGISVSTSSGSAEVALANTYTASSTFTNATITTDELGVISTIASGSAGSDTTYDLSVPDNTTVIRLAGSDSSNDDVTISGGTNVTVSRVSGTELSISASGGGSGSVTEVGVENGLALNGGGTSFSTTGTIGIANNGVTTARIDNNAVTYAKMQDMAANTILGNNTGSSADPKALSVSQAQTLLQITPNATTNTGTVTSVSGNNGLTGTVTGSGNIGIASKGVTTARIDDNAVTAAKLNVSGNGTSGQLLKSDGDGSFSWVNAVSVSGKVNKSGDTMTGDLKMSSASVIADNGKSVPNTSGNWDIQDSNVWQVSSGRTIHFPDVTDKPIPGQTGIFVCAGTVAGWVNINGGTWEHPAGTAQAGDAAGAIIPFYVQTDSRIILGTQTVGS